MSAKTKTLGKRPGGLSDRASDVVLVVLCVAILLVVAYPLYYILVASFSDDSILLGYWNRIKYTVGGTLFSVVMIYITAYPPCPVPSWRSWWCSAWRLLERLVHRPDLHDRRRPRPPAPGAAQHPHRQRNLRQPGQHDLRRVCRTEQAHRNDQVRLHHRSGRPPCSSTTAAPSPSPSAWKGTARWEGWTPARRSSSVWARRGRMPDPRAIGI